MIKMTMKKMTIVACWHVVHVVLYDDGDDDLHNKNDDDDVDNDDNDNNGNEDGKDDNGNDDYDDSCFLARDRHCHR